MYKNKIKSKLQKMYNRGIEIIPDRPPQTALQKNDSFIFKSSRRGKLSLSKDLSVASNNSIDHHESNKKQQSFSQSKRSYIRLVSNSAKKDLSCLSSSKICITNHEGISERAENRQENAGKKSLFFENEPQQKNHRRNKSTFDANELRTMAFNIAKSAAILNEKIVPVLLQAASLSSKTPNNHQDFEDNLTSMFLASTNDLKDNNVSDKNHYNMLQTPINHLKNQSFDESESQSFERKAIGNRCETQPSNPFAQKYKNRHKIEHSPTPIKNRSPHVQNHTPNSLTKKTSQRCQSKIITTQFSTDKTDINLHPLAKELQLINCRRKAAENRISQKLDDLSNKANSMIKQYTLHPQIQQHPKKPKVLLNSAKINVLIQEKTANFSQRSNIKSLADIQNAQICQQINIPSSKSKNMRNMIMNRIFS